MADLDDIYSARILELAGAISHIGRLPAPDASATAHSKLCGSTVTIDLTLKDGKTWFFSRTRNKYWMKGEESGNTQDVVEVLTDCDADTVIIKVKQNGPAACHTGNRSCFYVKWENGEWVEHSKPLFDPAEVYKK